MKSQLHSKGMTVSDLRFVEHPVSVIAKTLSSHTGFASIVVPDFYLIPTGLAVVMFDNLACVHVDMFMANDPADKAARFSVRHLLGDGVEKITAPDGAFSGTALRKRRVGAKGLLQTLTAVSETPLAKHILSIMREGFAGTDEALSERGIERTVAAWAAIRRDDRASLERIGPVSGRRLPWGGDALMLAIAEGSSECCKHLVAEILPSSSDLADRWMCRPSKASLTALVQSHKRPACLLKNISSRLDRADHSIREFNIPASLTGMTLEEARSLVDEASMLLSMGKAHASRTNSRKNQTSV